jgi:hypothetical protein
VQPRADTQRHAAVRARRTPTYRCHVRLRAVDNRAHPPAALTPWAMQEQLGGLQSGPTARAILEREGGLSAAYQTAVARRDKARAAAGARTREIMRLSRLLDDIPSRQELQQYERRFVELFDEVSEKLDETRKYYTVYNTLDKKRQYLVKEESLLTSMLSSFSAIKVSSTASERDGTRPAVAFSSRRSRCPLGGSSQPAAPHSTPAMARMPPRHPSHARVHTGAGEGYEAGVPGPNRGHHRQH